MRTAMIEHRTGIDSPVMDPFCVIDAMPDGLDLIVAPEYFLYQGNLIKLEDTLDYLAPFLGTGLTLLPGTMMCRYDGALGNVAPVIIDGRLERLITKKTKTGDEHLICNKYGLTWDPEHIDQGIASIFSEELTKDSFDLDGVPSVLQICADHAYGNLTKQYGYSNFGYQFIISAGQFFMQSGTSLVERGYAFFNDGGQEDIGPKTYIKQKSNFYVEKSRSTYYHEIPKQEIKKGNISISLFSI